MIVVLKNPSQKRATCTRKDCAVEVGYNAKAVHFFQNRFEKKGEGFHAISCPCCGDSIVVPPWKPEP